MPHSIIDIDRKNISRAARVLVEASREDPFFKYVFDGTEHYNFASPFMFKSWIKWCMLYGKAWATAGYESVAIRKTTKKLDFSWWSLYRSGMLGNYKYLGKQAFERYMSIIQIMIEANKEILGEKPHWYAWVIGTLPEEQGRGFGSALMNNTFELARQDKVPIYLETYTESNVELHTHFGYKLVKTVPIPGSQLIAYFMVKECG
jgi:GNAT superfamily N-acetyltransferase